MRLLLLPLLAVLFCLPTQAASGTSPHYSRFYDEASSLTLLINELRKVDEYSYNVGNVMHEWITTSVRDHRLCEHQDQTKKPQLFVACIRHDLTVTINIAFKTGRIDEVERTNLSLLLQHLTIKSGQLTVLPIGPSMQSRVFNRKKRRVDTPSLGSYEATSNFFRKRRIQNGRPGDLDPAVLKLLEKAYHRKVLGLGKVGPEEYILSKYSALQINMMSSLIMETMEWTDQNVTGSIVLDRVGLTEKRNQLVQLEKQFVRDVQNGTATPSAIAAQKTAIENLKQEIKDLDTLNQIFEMHAQRYTVAIALDGLPNDTAYATERSELTLELRDLEDQIDELQDRLENERIEINLLPGDLHRLAMNHLDIRLETESRKAGSLAGFDGNHADLLVACYLTGDIDGDTLKALLQIEDYQEIRESFWKKTGKFLWVAGRMYLMLNPYTVIPTTLISVAISAFQKKKEYEKEMAEKTYLIRQ